jgi:hypothetical protein
MNIPVLPSRLVPSLAAAAILGLPAFTAAQEAPDLTRWIDAVRAAEVDAAAGADVQDIVLTRDVGEIHLEEGTVHLLPEIDGRRWGAYFSGTGRFRLTPPLDIEADQVERYWGSREIDRPFVSAMFVFTDGTLSELVPGALSALPVPDDADDDLDEAAEYISNGDGWLTGEMLTVLANDLDGYFYAHMAEDRGDPVIFAYDPLRHEEVSVSRRAEGRGRVREVVTSFQRAEDVETGGPPPEASDIVEISHMDIEVRVSGGLDYSGSAVATIEPAARGPWVQFGLHHELDVREVAWEDGSPTTWYREDGSTGGLWVDLGDRVGRGGDLRFTYDGDLLARPNDLWVTTEAFHYWYPLHSFGRSRTNRVTFELPEDYIVGSVGTRVSETVTGDRRTSVWETGQVDRVSFNIGEFDTHEAEFPGAPPVVLHYSESAHREFRNLAQQAGVFLYAQGDMAQQVAFDILRSFSFYTQTFGPPVVDEFLATEIPYSHGEALPGVVLLSQSTFQYTDQSGYNIAFRGHEVAHQWWGIGVKPLTPRDRWLAEGFSEYSGLWYAARSSGSLAMYTDQLEEKREAILDRRDRAVPLGFGTRAATSEDPGDYQVMIYDKGAWVLHMLRGLLTDPSGDDSAFAGLMQSYYAEHRGGTATTADFQRHAEAAAGRAYDMSGPMDLDWFFEQWVYGNAIPTYRWSWTSETAEDGSSRVRMRVRQEDVPPDFRMVVPVLLDFGDAGQATVQVTVEGAETETLLPPLPMEPLDVVFNPNEAVLAETRREGWRDQ